MCVCGGGGGIFAMFCQRKRVEYLLDDPMYDDGVRENVVAYDEEGAGQYMCVGGGGGGDLCHVLPEKEGRVPSG